MGPFSTKLVNYCIFEEMLCHFIENTIKNRKILLETIFHDNLKFVDQYGVDSRIKWRSKAEIIENDYLLINTGFIKKT